MNQATHQDNKLWILTASSLVTAGLCFQWTRFIRSVDLGDNDFGGLLYLLIEGGLLIITGALIVTSLAGNIRPAANPETRGVAAIRIFFTVLAASIVLLGFRVSTATKTLDDLFTNTQESAFTELLYAPFQLPAAALVTAIGIYHLTLSIRVLIGRCTEPSPCIHLILLFANPCLALMFALIALPTTIPGLFISGIDESEPLRHALRFSSALASLCTVLFVPNLVLSLVALTRTSRLSQSR